MDHSTPGFPVLHHFPEFAQTHVHWFSDAIQPSHPLSSPYPPAFYLSQHQGLFQRFGSSHQVAKILGLQLQHQSFQWLFKTDFLSDWLVWSPCSPGDSQESPPTPQFESINYSALSLLYGPTLTSIHDYWKKIIASTRQIFVSKVMSLLFSMLSRLVIAFLPRNKHLLISWLQSLSIVTEPLRRWQRLVRTCEVQDGGRLNFYHRVLNYVRHFATPWIVTCQAPLFLKFSRQE